MSECKICAKNGKAGIQIVFSDKIRSQYSQKMIPLETDGSTYHRHYEPIAIANKSPNPTPANSNTITESNAWPKDVRSITSDNKQEDETIEALTLEFHTLLKHVTDYLKQRVVTK